MEFDRFEEFGEYEIEIEKGGEVQLEQLHLIVELRPDFNLRVGRLKVPVGWATLEDEPKDYLTTTRSPLEVALLPNLWTEDGAEVFGTVTARGAWDYRVAVVNGLDSSAFSSANWIANGHQMRFEMVNAEDLAITGRLDYAPHPAVEFGAAAYWGDSADNRPKPDLAVDAHVLITDVHLALAHGPLQLRSLFLYGTLENAAAVSYANRNLSNNLGVKRTPVGSVAKGWFVEGSYDVLRARTPDQLQLLTFVRYEDFDSMAETEGEVFDNPRWERRIATAGINFRTKEIVAKLQYAHTQLGLASDNTERTFSMGFGFEF
jgi:hypothetical protein